MGRGSSKAGGGSVTLSASQRSTITNGIATHTSAQNDRAERNYQNNISREKNIIDNYDTYVRARHITGRSDPWWKNHETTYKTLVAQYNFFKKERKRLKK